jgi:hypothetical protein
MPGGEAVGPSVLGHVPEAERLRVPDQLAEHPVATRQRPDHTARLLVDPHEDEPLELLLTLVEDAESRVACARNLAGRLEHMAQDSLDLELGDERSPDIEQLAELKVAQFHSP